MTALSTRPRHVLHRIRIRAWMTVSSGGSVASWIVRTTPHGLQLTVNDQVAYSAILARCRIESALA